MQNQDKLLQSLEEVGLTAKIEDEGGKWAYPTLFVLDVPYRQVISFGFPLRSIDESGKCTFSESKCWITWNRPKGDFEGHRAPQLQNNSSKERNFNGQRFYYYSISIGNLPPQSAADMKKRIRGLCTWMDFS